VDVSGDGVNNQGAVPQAVYGSHLLDGVTVNALLIRKPPGDERHTVRTDEDGQLVSWFQSAVLHGRGAFHIVADGYEDYERAMTAKLLRELEMPMMSGGDPGCVGGMNAWAGPSTSGTPERSPCDPQPSASAQPLNKEPSHA
jgi:hypothetical protein